MTFVAIGELRVKNKEQNQRTRSIPEATLGPGLRLMGAQWLSGRVLDSRPRGSPASLCCVLEQEH